MTPNADIPDTVSERRHPYGPCYHTKYEDCPPCVHSAWEEGVQAAREAVADLTPFVFAYQTWISGDYGYDEGPWVKKENALAVIEALGGER